jgi:uncharacterized membrane protein YccC
MQPMKNPGPALDAFFKNPVVFYLLNCLVGISIGYVLYVSFPRYQFVWTMISTLIVLSPEEKNVGRIAFDRVKANLLGSSFGLFLFLLHHPNLLSLCAGIACIVGICSALNIMHAVRAALVAFLIVTVHQNGGRDWTVAAERMGCVAAGCIIAIAVTFVLGRLLNRKSSTAG